MKRGESIEDLVAVSLDESMTEKTVQIGSRLSLPLREQLVSFLQYKDVFAWSYEDMPGIDPRIMVHRLNVDPAFKPKVQKRRTFNLEHYIAINQEVEKLLEANTMRVGLQPEKRLFLWHMV